MEKIRKLPKERRRIRGSTIFVILMLAYPVAHFLLMWIGVNINSIFLTFKNYNSSGNLDWLTWDHLFDNYKILFLSFKDPNTQQMFLVSLGYFVVSCLITLPIALFFSYFMFKKIKGNGFFKIIFYLPSILPLVILTLVFSLSLDPSIGIVSYISDLLNVKAPAFFIGENAKYTVYFFCIWAGIGYDVILLSAGMSRIPREILESSKIDGTGTMCEFFRIIVPLTWPTITTLFVLGMMSVFNVYLQPFFLTAGQYGTTTIGLQIYWISQGNTNLQTGATLGLFCSLIGAPVILGVRALMNRCYADVDF